MRVARTVSVRLASKRSAVIEVEVMEDGPPRKWRLRLALWLIRTAGRLARMRVRVSHDALSGRGDMRN